MPDIFIGGEDNSAVNEAITLVADGQYKYEPYSIYSNYAFFPPGMTVSAVHDGGIRSFVILYNVGEKTSSYELELPDKFFYTASSVQPSFQMKKISLQNLSVLGDFTLNTPKQDPTTPYIETNKHIEVKPERISRSQAGTNYRVFDPIERTEKVVEGNTDLLSLDLLVNNASLGEETKLQIVPSIIGSDGVLYYWSEATCETCQYKMQSYYDKWLRLDLGPGVSKKVTITFPPTLSSVNVQAVFIVFADTGSWVLFSPPNQ